MLDKGKSKLPVAVKEVIIVGIGVAIVLLGIRLIFDTNPFYVVSSGSMEPSLMVNDVLVVRDGDSFPDLVVGDVIVFNKPDTGDRVIVHRVNDIDIVGSERVIQTKGDANPGPIPGTDYPIKEDDYIGKVIYVVPGVGGITKIIAPPVNYIIIAVILAILFFSRMGGGKKKQPPAPPSTSTSPSSSDPPGESPPPSS